MSNIKKQSKKKVKRATVVKKVKSKNTNLRIAFYLILAIVVFLIIYLVRFRRPSAPILTNENNLINEMLKGGATDNDTSYCLNLPSSFKVFRQSSSNSSGPATIMNILSFYAKDQVFTEKFVEGMKSKHKSFHKGTCVNQFKEIFSTLNFSYFDDTTYKSIEELQNISVGLKLIEESIKAGYPVVVGWNKRPGHWSLVVGYDNKSTYDTSDDIIIMADSDSSKGINNVSASEFESKWTFGDFFKDEPTAHKKSNKCFLILDKYY